jgi:hypothetical protein
MSVKDRITYLTNKLPKTVKNYNGETVTVEEKYRANFEKYARYLGNGVYTWKGITATDTAVLFLMGVLFSERIKFKQE